jgi:hypothetical protein
MPSADASACACSPPPPSCAPCPYRSQPAAPPQTRATRPPPQYLSSFAAAPASALLAYCTMQPRPAWHHNLPLQQPLQIKNASLPPSRIPVPVPPLLLSPLPLPLQAAACAAQRLPLPQSPPLPRLPRFLHQRRLPQPACPVPPPPHSRNTHLSPPAIPSYPHRQQRRPSSWPHLLVPHVQQLRFQCFRRVWPCPPPSPVQPGAAVSFAPLRPPPPLVPNNPNMWRLSLYRPPLPPPPLHCTQSMPNQPQPQSPSILQSRHLQKDP